MDKTLQSASQNLFTNLKDQRECSKCFCPRRKLANVDLVVRFHHKNPLQGPRMNFKFLSVPLFYTHEPLSRKAPIQDKYLLCKPFSYLLSADLISKHLFCIKIYGILNRFLTSITGSSRSRLPERAGCLFKWCTFTCVFHSKSALMLTYHVY